MKVIAVIPAFNEERTIATVISEAKNYCDGVIVVDDGSIDRTPKIIQGLDIMFALCGHNQGAGSATGIGLRMALEAGADVVVTLDGDGQHDAREIPALLEPFGLYGNIGVVIGSRFLNHNTKEYTPEQVGFYSCYAEEYQQSCSVKPVPKYRKFGIDVITSLYNLGHRHRITDSQCGFRAYSRAFLDGISIKENGFGFSTEVLLKALKLGLAIVEVPVSCIYRSHREDSTLNPIRHGFVVAWQTIKWRLKLWI